MGRCLSQDSGEIHMRTKDTYTLISNQAIKDSMLHSAHHLCATTAGFVDTNILLFNVTNGVEQSAFFNHKCYTGTLWINHTNCHGNNEIVYTLYTAQVYVRW